MRTTVKPVRAVFLSSEVTVLLAVPDDKGDYDYDQIGEDACSLIASNLGIPAMFVSRALQGIEVGDEVFEKVEGPYTARSATGP